MSQQELKSAVEKIIDDNAVGTMATVKQDKPHSRYMTFIRKGLKLYTATSIATHKSEEIKANPYTHILLGYEGEGFGDEYVEYEGRAAINSSVELKQELWNSYMEHWFNGPDDSNYIVLEIIPVTIRIMNKKGAEPKTVEF
ncbi:pyridoxamine 5'-phosphate oxidase family protein [Lentibacillus sp.]|uniref:pyridoxamine 5'-phosphate oxidase family protein n=1 Tax=Lentibacillus sp. TaxID=1925746 RepID=UPI002B4B6277|nr:pyridoxamine 5'-phosphate oxidase family protein [Lentibacillus sp.]HLS07527.1 pyridoxamine 5'-phosphate oxidase family protein [Lentibacillus sp.]